MGEGGESFRGVVVGLVERRANAFKSDSICRHRRQF